jgi:hypothetical protein
VESSYSVNEDAYRQVSDGIVQEAESVETEAQQLRDTIGQVEACLAERQSVSVETIYNLVSGAVLLAHAVARWMTLSQLFNVVEVTDETRRKDP